MVCHFKYSNTVIFLYQYEMNLITIEEYFKYIHNDVRIANSLPTHELVKAYQEPLSENDIIYVAEELLVSKFPNSFIDTIIKYEFNTLKIGNITFGEIPNAYAYPLQWLIDLDKFYMEMNPIAFKKIKEQNHIVIARADSDPILLDLMNGNISVVPKNLDLNAKLKISHSFTDFMSYLVTGIILTVENNQDRLINIIRLEFGKENLIFWKSVFP